MHTQDHAHTATSAPGVSSHRTKRGTAGLLPGRGEIPSPLVLPPQQLGELHSPERPSHVMGATSNCGTNLVYTMLVHCRVVIVLFVCSTCMCCNFMNAAKWITDVAVVGSAWIVFIIQQLV